MRHCVKTNQTEDKHNTGNRQQKSVFMYVHSQIFACSMDHLPCPNYTYIINILELFIIHVRVLYTVSGYIGQRKAWRNLCLLHCSNMGPYVALLWQATFQSEEQNETLYNVVQRKNTAKVLSETDFECLQKRYHRVFW